MHSHTQHTRMSAYTRTSSPISRSSSEISDEMRSVSRSMTTCAARSRHKASYSAHIPLLSWASRCLNYRQPAEAGPLDASMLLSTCAQHVEQHGRPPSLAPAGASRSKPECWAFGIKPGLGATELSTRATEASGPPRFAEACG